MRRKSSASPVLDPVSSVPAPKRKPIPLPKGWAKADDALDAVESVSTIFPDFNRAVRCGGLPVRRIHTVHGPTHGGKTAFVLGQIKSFIDGDHYAALVDAEHATGKEFVTELFGDLAGRDNFIALRPHTYEETIDAVDTFLKHVKEARKDNPALKSICVVDSINKLVPKKELEKLLKEGADELTKGHWGRYRAALNQGWLDHVTALLEASDCAFVIVAQERDDNDPWAKDDFKVKGGRSVAFDASLLIRVSKAKPIFEPAEPKEGNIVGFQHRVRIHKNKVGHMDGRHSDCVFHLSNGRFSPPGFDLARDAVYVGKNLGVIQVNGSWFSWKRTRWQGETKAVVWLTKNQSALHELVAEINVAMKGSANG